MRLDIYLYESGLAKSRTYAAELIKHSLVTVNGDVINKPSYETDGKGVSVEGELYSFVGRGGVKLDFALDRFDIDVFGMTALDIGASTGGFTDCLLKRGARKVYALDSGHGQLDRSLADDVRVVNMEGVNAKTISLEIIPEKIDIAVCDVSFISQTLFLSELRQVLSEDGTFVTLIKPQFECGKSALGKGGIVKDKKYHYEAIKKVVRYAEASDFQFADVVKSPVLGGDGNTEFLVLFNAGFKTEAGDAKLKEVSH